MTPAQLNALVEAATKRLNDHIARVAGQQLRRMRESWKATK